jgi:hypothetical protein
MAGDASSRPKFYMHVSKNVSKSWTTDQPFCAKLCSGWVFLFTQEAGTHLRNSSWRRSFVSCACRNKRLEGIT